jgi:hypothetical protein
VELRALPQRGDLHRGREQLVSAKLYAAGVWHPRAAADLDGDGTLDGFTNVTPGSLLYFEVQARNTHVRGLPIPQSFLAYIDVVIAATGGAVVSVLDTNDVSILVPPDIKQ